MKYQAYIFDLDGTLLDTSPGVYHSMRHALIRCGRPVPGDNVLMEIIGPTLHDSFIHLFGFSSEEAEEGVRIYREEYSAGAMFLAESYPGIEELLRTLKEAGCSIGLASYKLERFTRPVLARFGLAEYFDLFCGSLEGVAESKGDIIRRCMTELSYLPEDVVMIGDTPSDAVGAKDAGIDFIGAGYGFGFDMRKLSLPYPAPMAKTPLDILSYC